MPSTTSRELAGLVCESFAFRVPAPDFALAALKGLSHLAPHAHVLHLKNEDFSRDPAVVARMNADPLIAHETQPTRTVAEMVRADERLEQAFPRPSACRSSSCTEQPIGRRGPRAAICSSTEAGPRTRR